MKITDPIIELLAIKLMEHDSVGGKWPPPNGMSMSNWMKTDEDDREAYRRMARGQDEIPGNTLETDRDA